MRCYIHILNYLKPHFIFITRAVTILEFTNNIVTKFGHGEPLILKHLTGHGITKTVKNVIGWWHHFKNNIFYLLQRDQLCLEWWKYESYSNKLNYCSYRGVPCAAATDACMQALMLVGAVQHLESSGLSATIGAEVNHHVVGKGIPYI